MYISLSAFVSCAGFVSDDILQPPTVRAISVNMLYNPGDAHENIASHANARFHNYVNCHVALLYYTSNNKHFNIVISNYFILQQRHNFAFKQKRLDVTEA